MCQMCQMPNIWHTKHKNGVLSDVLNLKNYSTLLQYCLKYETVWTTIAKSNIIILLHFSLSSSIDTSLSVDSISFLPFLSVSISSLSSLLKKVAQDHSPFLAAISPPHSPQLTVDLIASCSSPRRRHPQPSPPTFKSLLIELWVWDLGWVSMWVLGQRFGSALYGLWVEVLGWLGWGFRPIVGWVWLVGWVWVGVFSSLVCWLVECFFFPPLLLRFLDLEFVGVVAIDIVAVIDDNEEEIIYYFNV